LTGLVAGAWTRCKLSISMVMVAAMLSACASSGGSLDEAVDSVAPTTAKYAAIVVDEKSGKMLYGANVNELRYPASLTKMMTLYMMFEAMDQGRISRDTAISGQPQRRAPPTLQARTEGRPVDPGRHRHPGACGQIRQ
jgi:D-alanyl-D-alanine carboxypeptidase